MKEKKKTLQEKYRVIKYIEQTYNKLKYYIVTPDVISKWTKEPEIVAKFTLQPTLGCCGSTILGDIRYWENSLIDKNQEDREYIIDLILGQHKTNNLLITDTMKVDDENSIYDLLKLVQPQVKPVDSFFNENSGNTVVIYSYNKVK